MAGRGHATILIADCARVAWLQSFSMLKSHPNCVSMPLIPFTVSGKSCEGGAPLSNGSIARYSILIVPTLITRSHLSISDFWNTPSSASVKPEGSMP